MVTRLPPLSALPAFESTARLGSVTAAAQELGRTHSAVSKQLRSLREDLGCALFEKDGTGLRLTAAGKRLQQSLTPMIAELRALAAELRAQENAQVIRLSLSATLAARWLTPRLPRFYARHPAIRLELLMSGPHAPRQDFDLGISYDRLRDPILFQNDGADLDSLSLGDTTYAAVCAPGYETGLELDEVNACIHVATCLTHSGAPQQWEAWAKLTGRPVVAATTEEHPHHMLELEAAAAGLGLALAERRLVESDLALGRLTAPLGFYQVKDGFQAGVSPSGRSKPWLQDFISWLQEEAQL